jgi:chromosome partitioning protein
MLEIAKDLGDAHYRALLTIVPPKPNKEGETIKQELIEGGVPVFETMIRRTIGFPKAALAGVPLRDLADSRLRIAWKDYQSLGKEIEEILDESV